MKRRDILDFIITVVVSGVIGGCVALFLYSIEKEDVGRILPLYLLLSCAAGCTIGLSGKILFGVIFTRINSHPVFAFFSVSFVIAGGTFIWSLIIKPEIGIGNFVAVGVSEIVGMTATAIFWKSSSLINLKLKKKQDQLSTRDI